VKVVFTSTDLSFMQSAQIALDAHGIDAVLSDDNLTGLPSSPMTLAVSSDADFERALAVLQGLQRTPPRPGWEAPWAPRAILIVIIIMVAVVCGILIY